MGDIRFLRPLEKIYDSRDKTRAIHELPDDEVVQALAAFSRDDARRDPYVANVLATEAMNRMQRSRIVAMNLVEGVIHVDEQNRILEANPAALKLLAWDATVARGEDAMTLLRPSDIHGNALPRELCPLPRALLTGEQHEGEVILHRADGGSILVSYTSAPVLIDGDLVGAVLAFRDMRRTRREREREAYLARIAPKLSSSLNADETFRNIVEAAVPTLADWAALHLLEEDGTLRPAAVAHADPEKLALVKRFQAQNVRNIIDDLPIACVMRTDEPLLIQRITDDVLRAGTKTDEQYELARTLRARSAIVVPLTARDRTIGTLTLVRAETPLEYDEEDIAFARDIGARAALAADNALLFAEASASAQRLRGALETMGEGVVLTSRSGLIRFVNDEALDILGADRSQMQTLHLGDPKWEFQDWDGRPMESPGKLVMKTGRPVYDARLSIRNARTGERRYLLVNYAPMQGDGIVASFVDLTEQRRLMERDRRLANIVETSNDAILHKTLDGIILDWNEGARRMFGYESREVIGKHVSILIPADHSDDLFDLDARAARGDRVEPRATQRQRKDGSLIDVSLLVSPVMDSSGRVASLSATYRDITESKRTQDRLREELEVRRALFESLPDRIYTLDASRRIIDANPAAAPEGPSKLRGRPFLEFVHPDDAAAAERLLSRAQRGRLRLADGGPHEACDVTVLPLRVGGSEGAYILARPLAPTGLQQRVGDVV